MQGARLVGGPVITLLTLFWRELILFAGVGFLIGVCDELVVDMIWLARATWRRLFVYARHARATATSLGPPLHPGPLVIFIAAWDEGAVIGAMLCYALATFDHPNYRIYLGCYPNDPATSAVARAINDDRLRVVIGTRDGPTTKADCLNMLWRALLHDEVAQGFRAKAIILHDAEDVVHAQELRVFDSLIDRFALVQLPVRPLPNPRSNWIAGHYCDEFAEAHGKVLVVREALGAAIPAAGVGCAFSRALLGTLADARHGQPFDAASLTEDYELGLHVRAATGRGILARVASGDGLVEITAHFPATLEAAVRQRTRWITGIAFAGYDRLGWEGGLAERWMRLRDRRAPFAALQLCVGYLAILVTGLFAAAHILVRTPLPTLTPALRGLVAVNALMLLWRLCVRVYFVQRSYSWTQGLLSIPRVFVSNVIAMMAARRAVIQYLRMRRTGVVLWDKTQHAFPMDLQAE